MKEDRVTQEAYNKWTKKIHDEKAQTDEEYLNNLYTEYLQATANATQDETSAAKDGRFNQRGSDDYSEISD